MSNQSVIKYKPSFVKSELVRTKLKIVATKEEEMCVTFDTGGIEILLYVIEDFRLVMESLAITDTVAKDKFFKKILGHGPSEKWKKLKAKNFYVDTVIEGVTTVTKFDKALNGFIATYCTSQDPKGDLIEYLKSTHCMKPREKSVAEHQDRLEELMRYSTHLEGTRADLSESEQKLILFGSFPIAWQINWKRTQRRIQDATVEEMMIYMNQEKEISDSTSTRNHRTDDHTGRGGRGNRGGRGRGRGGRGRGRGREDRRQGRGGYELTRCTQHQGQHLWKECPDNRRSDAYKRANGNGGRGRGRDGRGRGRGYEQSYHTQHPFLPPPPSANYIPPSTAPPVSQVGAGESHYYAQYGGSQPPSVAPTYGTTYMSNLSSPTNTKSGEFYMASDGHFYPK